MGRRRSHEPCDYTCPKIDEVISFIRNTCADVEDLNSMEYIDIMEQIRDDNDKLRTWGNEMYDDRNYFEEKCDGLEMEIESLKSEVEYLQKQIDRLSETVYE